MSFISGIRSVETKTDDKGNYTNVRIVFGPHYFIEIQGNTDGDVELVLGATHHGFKADASSVGGELEKIIYEIRKAHPQNMVD